MKNGVSINPEAKNVRQYMLGLYHFSPPCCFLPTWCFHQIMFLFFPLLYFHFENNQFYKIESVPAFSFQISSPIPSNTPVSLERKQANKN